MQQSFNISVVVPVYNVESYLDEALRSVVGQSIGFESCVQLVLVDDGSTDGSAAICERYTARYPHNVAYVSQENAGVSAARNAGLALACGELITFMDADDVWSADAFEQVWARYLEWGATVDVLACRQRYFEGKSGYHGLDAKFASGDRVVDIVDEPSAIVLSVHAEFVRISVARSHEFVSGLKVGEDSRYITECMLERGHYGLVAGAEYAIRKRVDETSATQNYDITRYTTTLTSYYEYLAALKDAHPRYAAYLDYCIFNGMRYRLREMPEIKGLDVAAYRSRVLALVRQCCDESIAYTARSTMQLRAYYFGAKYGFDCLARRVRLSEGHLFFDDFDLGALTSAGFELTGAIGHDGRLGIAGVWRTALPTMQLGVLIGQVGGSSTGKDDAGGMACAAGLADVAGAAGGSTFEPVPLMLERCAELDRTGLLDHPVLYAYSFEALLSEGFSFGARPATLRFFAWLNGAWEPLSVGLSRCGALAVCVCRASHGVLEINPVSLARAAALGGVPGTLAADDDGGAGVQGVLDSANGMCAQGESAVQGADTQSTSAAQGAGVRDASAVQGSGMRDASAGLANGEEASNAVASGFDVLSGPVAASSEAVDGPWLPSLHVYSSARASAAKEAFGVSRASYIRDALYAVPDAKLKALRNSLAAREVARDTGLPVGYVFACMLDVRARFGVVPAEFAAEGLIACATEAELVTAARTVKQGRRAVAKRVAAELGITPEEARADLREKRRLGIEAREYWRAKLHRLSPEEFAAYRKKRKQRRRKQLGL